MRIKFYGTRGSVPVAGAGFQKYGGNTTCVRVDSSCLPEGTWLAVDAGSGLVPLSWDFAKAGGGALTLLLTHFHHDHTQGLLLTHFPYVKDIRIDLVGPYEHGFGARQVYQTIMQPPFFPVHYKEISSHIHCHNVEFPNSTVLVIHPRGGMHLSTTEAYERLLASGRQLAFPGGHKFDVDECLVVHMYRSNHPEQTISYRFEEKPTGSVFVFVTDHENEAALPARFRQHMTGADLLVMDCQYTRDRYERTTAGFGHGTPDYVASVAREMQVPRLGLTHHDPSADDAQVDRIVAIARELLPGTEVFGCQDFQEVDLQGSEGRRRQAPAA